MRSTALAALAAVAALGGCGGGQREQIAREAQSFHCRDRRASYIVTHHMADDEIGVQIDCADAGPRIKRWRTDKRGTHQEDARSMTPGEFDKVWREIDGTGWTYLHDCGNGTGGKRDPVYVFDIKDDQNQASFQCQSQSMPYPYNDIVDPLDLAAQQGRRQLGDDEPREMKALDHKDKQR
ncbi:MAG TPA: hypothetical protein VK601_01620 [Kofleriaceae bacterium]|nr:hypothetical protein [Kofleriaceae bacterium]